MAGYRKRKSTIGLDYGTHSTKVVHRIRGEGMGRVVRFDRTCDGYPLNAAPSVMREYKGLIYFGTIAVELREGIDLGSMKAELLGTTGDLDLDRRIDVLAAAYLAWTLGEIFSQDPQLAADNPIIQVSAPTCQAGNSELKQRYERIVHAAYICNQTYGMIEQGVEETWLYESLGPVLHADIPPSRERRFFVAPETIAPMVSLQLEPLIDTGIFLIADMGAATTEISICARNVMGSGDLVLAYADSTERRGGNDLDEMTQTRFDTSSSKIDDFLQKLKLQAHGVWSQGFKTDMDNRTAKRQWRRLQVLLTGGATHHPKVRKHFENEIDPLVAWPREETSKTLGRHCPKTLQFDAGFEDDDSSLFAVANGLSVQLPLWPRFFNETEIPRLAAAERGDLEVIPSYLEIG